MTIQHARSSLVLILAVTTAACTIDPVDPEVSTTGADSDPQWEEFRAHPPVTWEDFLARTERLLEDPAQFVVDGDILLSSEAELRAHYEAWLEQEFAQTEGQSLTVLRALGADVIWPSARRMNLTFCISNAFGSRKAAVVTAMNQATSSWSARVAVRFRYVPAQDATCTNTNNNVLFNVVPSTGSFFASSFFPNSARANRQLRITSSAFTTTAGGRDLQGILRHETGHVLGFRHEHIHISCTTESTANSRLVTSYDVNSVMHYPQCRPSGRGGYRQTALDFAGAVSLYGAP
jgi:hypothetical protein